MRSLSALLIAISAIVASGFAQSRYPKISIQAASPGKDALKPVEQNGKWGFENSAGNLVIPPKYFAALPFNDGYALVVTRKPWKPLGDEVGEFRLAQVTWIDSSGREIRRALSVRRAWSFSDGLAAVVPDVVMRIKAGCAKGGYIDTKGRWAIKAQFDGVTNFSEGLASVNLGANCGMGGKWGYIDIHGNIVIPFRFLSSGEFHDGRACVLNQQEKWEVIDRSGNAVSNEKCN